MVDKPDLQEQVARYLYERQRRLVELFLGDMPDWEDIKDVDNAHPLLRHTRSYWLEEARSFLSLVADAVDDELIDHERNWSRESTRSVLRTLLRGGDNE